MHIHRRARFACTIVGSALLVALGFEIPGPALGATESPIPLSQIEPVPALERGPTPDRVEARFDEGTGATASRVFERFSGEPIAVLVSAGVGFSMLLMGVVLLVRRRPSKGIATISIQFPDNMEGVFRVDLRQGRLRRRGNRGTGPHSSRGRSEVLHTRSGVRRETQFEDLVPGFWVASLEGHLSAPQSGFELATLRRQEEFEVVGDEVSAVEIVLPKVTTQAELRVHWDRQPARDIGVSLRGRPETLRYSGQGVARLRVGPGTHEIVIGAGDRVVERTLEITDYEPTLSSVDLATSEGLVFKGCPPAVTSFLQGDLGGAARALERDGQNQVASLLLAELHQQQGQIARAAQALEGAGKPRQAADLRRSIEDYSGAAPLYEAANRLEEAAEMYASAEAWSDAARIFAEIEDWRRASQAFEKAGDVDGLIHALEVQQEFLRAAGLAAEHDDRARAIRLLQQVVPQDPDFGRASELLVLAFEQEGHLDLAAAQLERRLEYLATNETAPQLEFHLAELLEEAGNDERALDVLEVLRNREPTYPQVATRIEGLRKKLSASLRQSASGAFAVGAGATAFVAKSRYEIIDEIGSGGMGRVYKARDRRLGREVALKRMPENLRDHPAAVSLFLGEAQAAARMNHPNIVTLYDADQEAGLFFITMELLHGLPLNLILKEHGAFSAADTARLGLQACAGLNYAHAQGIVHRDIKTANFFVTKDKVLKIMDFGLAKMVEAVRDRDSTVIAGTPLYMAPEQADGLVVDGRTDLYGLGITLFELSTGRLPFFEGNVAEQHRHAEPPDPASIVANYPAALSSVILRMLQKRPEDRPESAADVAAELSAFLDDSMDD